MKKKFYFVLFLVAFVSVAYGQSAGRYVFQPSNFASEKSSETLPKGAVVILSINDIENTLVELDQLLTKFVPKELAPPPVKKLLSNPQAIIGFLSAQAFKTPMKAEQILQIFGLNSHGSIYVAMYPGDTKIPDIVLSIPISNHQKISGLMNNLLQIRKAENKNNGAQIIWKINSFNRDLPSELFITCSKENMYVSTTYERAKSLMQTTKESSIGVSPLFQSNIQNKNNINVLVDLNPLKKFYFENKGQFQMLDKLGIMQLHRLVAEIPPEQKIDINFRLQTQFGILSIDEAVKYIEAIIVSASPHLYKCVDDFVVNFQGFSFSVDFEQSMQTISFNVLSNDLKPSTFSIDKNELIGAINYLPGSRSAFSALSKAEPKSKESPWAPIIKSIKAELLKNKLSTEYVDKTIKSMNLMASPVKLNDIAQLVLQTKYLKFNLKSPKAYKNFSEYIKDFKSVTGSSFQKMTLLKGVSKGQVIAHYKSEVDFHKKNAGLIDSLLKMVGYQDEDYTKLGAFKSEVFKSNVTKVTIEKGFRINKGYFGYHEHDVINRQFLFFKPIDDFIMIENGQRKPNELISLKKSPTPESLTKLIGKLPAHTTSINVQRFLHLVPDLIDFLGNAEDAIHSEMDNFIAKVKPMKLTQATSKKALKDLDIPLVFSSINLMMDKQLSFRILGVLEYPRSKVMPLFKNIFRDVYTHRDKLGGSMAFCVKEKGVVSYRLVVSSEGLAHLISSVANNFATEHLHKPNGIAKLKMHVIKRNDGKISLNEVIFFNPIWEPVLKLVLSRL